MIFIALARHLGGTGRRGVIAFAAIALLAMSTAGGSVQAADSAGEFIQNLGERAVGVLRDKENTTFAEREFAFRNILVEGFHIKTISRFVLGRYWAKATDEQRATYNDVFVDFIVRVYASRFDAYDGEVFEITQAIESEIEGDTIVRTQILRPSGSAPIGVDYRVRKIDGNYKVVDVNVEGISMLHTHRVEFASVINRKGMDGFLEELRAQVEARGESSVN